MNKIKNYNSIDLLKFIFAVFVPILHISFETYSIFYLIGQYVSRLAVPFFFTATGFLLGNKLLNAENEAIANSVILKTAKRLLVLFLIWYVIYLPINFYTYYKQSGGLVSGGLAMAKQTLFLAPSYLWYIVASLIGVLLFYLFYKYKKVKWFGVFALIFYILGTLGNTYRTVINIENLGYYSIFLTTRNGVFFAPVFLYIGYYVSTAKGFTQKMQLNRTLCAVTFILYTLEVSYAVFNIAASEDKSMYFTLPLLMLFLFNILANIKDSESNARGFIRLRNASTFIYCCQFGVITIAGKFLPTNTWSGLLTLGAIIIINLVYVTVLEKTNSKLLKRLI